MSPWMRLDDGAMSHLKILRLTDSAFRLWIKGLCYCQQHLTDGLIPREALPTLGARSADVLKLSTPQVIDKAPLWEPVEGYGFQVHNFLRWNDSRDEVLRKREASKQRTKKHRSNASVAALVTPHSAVGGVGGSSLRSSEGEFEGKPSTLKQRPQNFGRIDLHRWQLDALIATLGPHAADFQLDEWVMSLSAREVTIPRGQMWAWVQAEFEAEIRRRGLPVAQPTNAAPTNKRIAGLITGGEAFLKRVQS